MSDRLSLTYLTGRAIGFRFIGSILNSALSLVIGIVLARILPPEEFGLFGVTMSIIVIAETLGNCGLRQALIQRNHLDPGHESVAAAFQLGIIGLIGILIFFLSPALALYLSMPGLIIIIKIQSLTLLLNALSLIPQVRLTRRLAFDLLTIIQVSSQLLGGVITICLALYGLGAMALAIGSLTTAIITLLLSWMFAPGLISLEFKGYHLRELLGYGSGALFIGIANSLVNRVDNLIVARQLGSEAVGLYQRAFHLIMLPLHHVTGSVHKVLFAAMSSIQKENARFQRAYLKAVRLSALVAFPLLTMLGTSADVVIPFVYGPMWEGTVPILQLLTTVGILRILSNTQGLVVQASGRPMTEAVLQAVWLALIIILGFLGSRAGVLGVVVGVFLATCVFCTCMTYLAHSIIDIKVVEWVKAMRTGLLGSVAMGLGILFTKTVCSTAFSDFVLLIVMTLSGLLIYITAVRLCHTDDDNELLSIISELFPPRLRHMMCLILGITPR